MTKITAAFCDFAVVPKKERLMSRPFLFVHPSLIGHLVSAMVCWIFMKFGVRVIYGKKSKNREFPENGYGESHALLRRCKNISTCNFHIS
jgi:hypothetical protein